MQLHFRFLPPAAGNTASCAHLVVVLICAESLGQPKITDLGVMLCHQQDISCRQISVHEITLLQVLHPHGHLVHQLDDVLVLDVSARQACH